jgi:hypothetical protein
MASLYPLGQPVRLSTTVKNSSETLADPGGISLTLYGPDGTVVQTYSSPTHDGTGLYHQDIPTTDLADAGHYRYVWTATGSNAGVDMDVFDVFDPAAYPRLVSFADAKSFLRLQGTGDDALLDRIIGWASARIGIEVTPYKQAFTRTITVRGGDPFFTLPDRPVRSVTSMTPVSPFSPAVDVANVWVANPNGGRVETTAHLAGTYTVVYQAGPDEVQPGVDGACLELIQHWWNQSQAHGSSTYGDTGFVPDFRDLPNTVKNMLAVAAPAWGAA